jgi:hypothetical protein
MEFLIAALLTIGIACVLTILGAVIRTGCAECAKMFTDEE